MTEFVWALGTNFQQPRFTSQKDQSADQVTGLGKKLRHSWKWRKMSISVIRFLGNCWKNQVAILSGMFIILLATPGEAATWAVYQDDTQKCRLNYASNVFTLGEIDEENFQRFSGPNRNTYFRITGLPNDEQLSPREIRAEYVKNRGKSDLVYERTKRSFLVLSGFRDEKIFYTKIAVSPNNQIICVLHIVYPRKDKRAFDAIVTRMSRSFRAVN